MPVLPVQMPVQNSTASQAGSVAAPQKDEGDVLKSSNQNAAAASPTPKEIFDSLQDILRTNPKANPLVVGEAGSGRTALLQALLEKMSPEARAAFKEKFSTPPSTDSLQASATTMMEGAKLDSYSLIEYAEYAYSPMVTKIIEYPKTHVTVVANEVRIDYTPPAPFRGVMVKIPERGNAHWDTFQGSAKDKPMSVTDLIVAQTAMDSDSARIWIEGAVKAIKAQAEYYGEPVPTDAEAVAEIFDLYNEGKLTIKYVDGYFQKNVGQEVPFAVF